MGSSEGSAPQREKSSWLGGMALVSAVLVTNQALLASCAEEEGGDVEEGQQKAEEVRKAVREIALEEVVSTAEEDARWEVEKEKCPFCRQFLLSPCKEEFKHWSKCVDKAKESDLDYIGSCSVFTRALMTCTDVNSEHFQRKAERDDDDEEEEEGEEKDSVKEEAEAEGSSPSLPAH